jgi:hypothetical protein
MTTQRITRHNLTPPTARCATAPTTG